LLLTWNYYQNDNDYDTKNENISCHAKGVVNLIRQARDR
jgi:hypothetical protein